MVLHRPQTLISSSPGTTSDGRIGARGQMAWCFATRKTLFLRRRAPRRMGESEHGARWRGASPPAKPYFFVAGHHVGWTNRRSEPDGVVPHRPLSLVPSSSSTTPLALVEPSEEPAWCFTARYPLFLRRRAPRHWPWSSLRRSWRGASSPAIPCFFVAGHHASDFLQPDNSGNPPRVPGIPISPKNEKCRPRCCSRNTLPTFPFPLSISKDCPLCILRGQSLSYPNPLLCFALLCFALLCSALLNFQKIKMERKTRFELATLALARRCSTPEPLPQQLLHNITF